jgi:hypothetical protein
MGDGDRSILCATPVGVGQLSKCNRKGIAVFPFGHTRSGSRPCGLTGDAHGRRQVERGQPCTATTWTLNSLREWGPEGD